MTVDLAARAAEVRRALAAAQATRATVSGESAQCGRCSDRGPHVYGEEAPTTGNQARRARLRRAQAARKR